MNHSKRVLVTGGSRGIGNAIAMRFAEEGHNVAILASKEETLATALREANAAGFSWVGAALDLEQADHIGVTIGKVIEELGGLDTLVNNAGIFEMAPLADISLPMWHRSIAINLTAPFLITQAALPALQKSANGQILNISSVAGQQGFPQNTIYCTTKYGLRGFSDALREEFVDSNMRVSTIYPGPTDTDIFDHVEGDWDRSSMNLREEVAEVVWNAYSAEEARADWNIPPRGTSHPSGTA